MKRVVALFFPRLSVTKACNYYFSVPSCHQSRVVEWRLERWNYDPEEPSSIFSLSSLTAKRICSRVHLLGYPRKKPAKWFTSGQFVDNNKINRLPVIVLPF